MVRIVEIVVDRRIVTFELLISDNASIIADDYLMLQELSSDFMIPASDLFSPDSLESLLDLFLDNLAEAEILFHAETQTYQLVQHAIGYLTRN